jgi:predicted TIM-barrel fold metal-dependent hydrolase
MKTTDRRTFLASSVAGFAATSIALRGALGAERAHPNQTEPSRESGIIDTNINLFQWPFRRLKYDSTIELTAKLKKHRIVEAWAGSFEALFAKDMAGVNERLARECKQHGEGLFIPFGSVNLAWPDWEEDLRRCHEVHNMPGLRIYPGYQPFGLDHPGMQRLMGLTAERGILLQIVFGMEDPRVHHPVLQMGTVALGHLLRWVEMTPKARVQLLHFPNTGNAQEFARFITQPNTYLDLSAIEGNGAIARMLGSFEALPSVQAPLDRILFGSHAPFFPVETALLKLIESPLEANQIAAITHLNARRLLPR